MQFFFTDFETEEEEQLRLREQFRLREEAEKLHSELLKLERERLLANETPEERKLREEKEARNRERRRVASELAEKWERDAAIRQREYERKQRYDSMKVNKALI